MSIDFYRVSVISEHTSAIHNFVTSLNTDDILSSVEVVLLFPQVIKEVEKIFIIDFPSSLFVNKWKYVPSGRAIIHLANPQIPFHTPDVSGFSIWSNWILSNMIHPNHDLSTWLVGVLFVITSSPDIPSSVILLKILIFGMRNFPWCHDARLLINSNWKSAYTLPISVTIVPSFNYSWIGFNRVIAGVGCPFIVNLIFRNALPRIACSLIRTPFIIEWVHVILKINYTPITTNLVVWWSNFNIRVSWHKELFISLYSS